jgi:hypothetical protein
MFGGHLSAGFKERLLSTPNISFSKQKKFPGFTPAPAC